MTVTGTNLSLEHYPYRSRRMPILAARGVVATAEPLAAQAGVQILQRGGNAIDAAIATAAALTVVEPTCNGVGGDAVALIWDGSRLHGLNGTGRALFAHTRGLFTERGLREIPSQGWLPVTVPGAPAAWRDMHKRFGRLPFETLFEPAIQYASKGFPVAPLTAMRWQEAANRYFSATVDDPALLPWRDAFTRDGRAPHAGDLWTLPSLANTLRELASTECESFYRGRLAEKIAGFAAATGGYITRADLEAHETSWVDPIKASYRGYEVWELPPSTPGIAALTALNILEGFDIGRLPRECSESYHLQVEAIKIALGDAYRYLADPDRANVPWRERLEKRYADEQRRHINSSALTSPPCAPPQGSTVYLCTADGDGLMVSFLQSNYSGWLLGFGSGVVVPETGIALHSRACGFSLEENHPNLIEPGKRPFHTLAPAFLTEGQRAIGPLGIMGGPMQPQAHVQFILNHIDWGMNPQAALDAPRFQWISGNRVEVELGVPPEVMQGLVARGHDVQPCVEFAAIPPRLSGPLGGGGLAMSGDFGKAQMIIRQRNGVYVGASDWRADGCAVGF